MSTTRSSVIVRRTASRTYSLKVRLTSPGASTTVPLTEPAAGNATTRPPGQCAIVLGPSVAPHEPAVKAPARPIRRSVPAGEVTCISLAPRRRSSPARTRALSAPSSGTQRSKASGSSFGIINTREPAPRIAGSSGACRSPSTVQSSTRSAAQSAAIAAGLPCSAMLEPVERIATGPGLAGVGTRTSTTRPPRSSAARRATSTSAVRLIDSLRTATTSPRVRPLATSARRKTSRVRCSIRRPPPCPHGRAAVG